jgi:hypothetical protein
LYLMWGYAILLPALQPAIPVTLFLGVLPLAFFWRPTAPRGSLTLLSALVLAPLLALGLMVDGEVLETYTVKTQPFLTWRTLSQWLAPRSLSDLNTKMLILIVFLKPSEILTF